MQKLKRFLFIYAIGFSIIWVGYGVFAIVTNQPHAVTVLGFGIAFSIVVCLASWFAYWLMNHYKRVDKMAKEIITHAKKKRTRLRNHRV